MPAHEHGHERLIRQHIAHDGGIYKGAGLSRLVFGSLLAVAAAAVAASTFRQFRLVCYFFRLFGSTLKRRKIRRSHRLLQIKQ